MLAQSCPGCVGSGLGTARRPFMSNLGDLPSYIEWWINKGIFNPQRVADVLIRLYGNEVAAAKELNLSINAGNLSSEQAGYVLTALGYSSTSTPQTARAETFNKLAIIGTISALIIMGIVFSRKGR